MNDVTILNDYVVYHEVMTINVIMPDAVSYTGTQYVYEPKARVVTKSYNADVTTPEKRAKIGTKKKGATIL